MTRKQWWPICRFSALVWLVSAAQSATLPVAGEIRERAGIARHNSLLEQGMPFAPMAEAEARRLVLRGAEGAVEPEAADENGNVRWVRVSARVSMPAGGRLPVRIEAAPGPEQTRQSLRITRADDGITAETSDYRLVLKSGGEIELTAGTKLLLKGAWGVDAIADARGILWGSNFGPFTPGAVEI
jgi:hypothetical protein